MIITEQVQGIDLVLHTNEEVFSPGAVDKGTKAMLSFVEFGAEDKVLDLGCGYGVVGIFAGKIIGGENVVMCDISETAIEYAWHNAELNQVSGMDIRLSNGFENIEEKDFTIILSNPPYHTDFSVAKHFIETGFKHLVIGGMMVMVTKRLEWYKNKLTSAFGGVRVYEIDGYYVFVAEKRSRGIRKKLKNEKGLSKKLRQKYGK